MSGKLKNYMLRGFYRMENSHLLNIVRNALIMMIPILVSGSMAYAVMNLPVDVFQELIKGRFDWIQSFLDLIYYGTFGLFSLELVITLSISYAIEQKEEIYNIFFYVVTAVACFGAQINMGSSRFKASSLEITGCFQAILVGLGACFLFSMLKRWMRMSLQKYTVGMEVITSNAVNSILPALVTIVFFAGAQQVLLQVSESDTLYELLTVVLCGFFEKIGDGFFPALLYTVLVHLLWLLGFHGSHMMESVALDSFSQFGEHIIFSKSYFDTYIVMGGCGTTISLVLAIFLVTRKKRMRNLGKIAFPMVVFNSNELLNFGIPLMLNPVLAVPFILIPVLGLILSYAATAAGLVPFITHKVVWTTPILFSGSMATGSLAGGVLQLVIAAVGILVYIPFVRLYEDIYQIRMEEKIQKLVETLKENQERNESIYLLHKVDGDGMVARMLLADLKTAVRKKELYLLYQPQVDQQGRCLGAEALLRWNHPEYGMIYPPLIIQLAKEGEILPELEKNLFQTAVQALGQVSAEYGYEKDFKISVNITASSLNWELEKYIAGQLEKYQVPAEKLWLEITEQDMLTNSEQITAKLKFLKEAGHTLLIDDFGMGHTSLFYLQSNYFDVVKLDGSLVKRILTNGTDQKIVASIVELGEKLDVKVIAEYVETTEQKEKLRELGCCWYQGSLFGEVVSLEQLMAEIKAGIKEKQVEQNG